MYKYFCFVNLLGPTVRQRFTTIAFQTSLLIFFIASLMYKIQVLVVAMGEYYIHCHILVLENLTCYNLAICHVFV